MRSATSGRLWASRPEDTKENSPCGNDQRDGQPDLSHAGSLTQTETDSGCMVWATTPTQPSTTS